MPVCETRIASLMAMEQPNSPAAQRKATEMYQKVEKPFEVYPGMDAVGREAGLIDFHGLPHPLRGDDAADIQRRNAPPGGFVFVDVPGEQRGK